MLGDGVEEFKRNVDPQAIANLVSITARWVDPDTFALLPVSSPHTYRKAPLYKSDWQERQTNRSAPKHEGNVAANIALTKALGLKSSERKNWSCCHIWGNDDASFQSAESEVNNPRYFTCLANMVLLPSPLKAFTDTIPEIKAALRIAAYTLYGFIPENRNLPAPADAGAFLPNAWLEENFNGIHHLNSKIRRWAENESRKIARLVDKPIGSYPIDQVREVIVYWNKKKPNSLLPQTVQQIGKLSRNNDLIT